MPGAPAKPEAGEFLSGGATKAEIERWTATLPAAERERATGFFTVVRRAINGTFSVVPYSVEYQNELAQAATLLREAAAIATEPTLKAFLTKRADAFLSNDYYDSDVAWMELKGAIEPTIGPYEVYEDEWFNAKAAFESFITVRDEAESAKLQKFGGELQDIEDHLPIDPKYRNPKLGGLAPLVVVNEILAAGDANHGVQTAAFNLPNDERVVAEKGSKRVMLKNVQDAKFAKTLVPISKVVLSPADQMNVKFDAFFTHIVVHELMHGLGPHNISVGGRQTTVRQELKETYSAIEEAKADISGLFAIQYMIDKGVLPKTLERTSLHDVSGVNLQVDSLRHQRSARAGDCDSAQLPDGSRWRHRAAGRHVRRRSAESQGRGRWPDARHHDAAGRGQLRGSEGSAATGWASCGRRCRRRSTG